MNSVRHPTTLLIPLIAVALGCARSEPDPLATLTSETRLHELEGFIPALMDSAGVPGLAMAIVSDTAIEWSRGFGVRSAETGAKVDPNTVFEAASLSKPVFAYAVLQMVDEGGLDLDTPIAEIYAEPVSPDPRYRRITPRMVLSHTPGFPNWRPRGGDLLINFDPGERFSYSGEGFGYLQRAVMHLTGEPLQDFAARRVFQPLGMTRSSYVWEERFDGDYAVPHTSDGTPLEKRKPQRGRGHAAATLHTTALDYGRFLIAVMNGVGLSDSMASAMLTSQVVVDSGVTWGLGIGLQESETGRAYWHWGDNLGFKAFTTAYPERGVGMVWFTNSDNGQALLSSLLRATVGGAQPGAAWLDYEQHDAPTRLVREQLWRTIEGQGVSEAIAEYHALKDTLPAEAFDEYVLNSLGYRLLRGGRASDAIAIFQLNVDEYPEAWNPYDSLGEAYAEAGDTAKAIAAYEQSIELNPENTNGAAILQRLRAQGS